MSQIIQTMVALLELPELDDEENEMLYSLDDEILMIE
jgi:hypothetical protein